MGYFVVYVDDVLIYAPTTWARAVVKSFDSIWECKLVGIIVRDGESTPLAVDKLVFLSITIGPVEKGKVVQKWMKEACAP
eukprot:3915892-Lingulodinium_polyedra.AAC.1